MHCYLCNGESFKVRDGEVRDNPALEILECVACGLVMLSSFEHIHSSFYQDSGMHGAEPTPMTEWLGETAHDDQRRFDMLKPLLANKRVLDFGCGAGGFLSRARSFSKSVLGVELEARVREHWRGEIEITADLNSVQGSWDVVTSFHVLEHLTDPVRMLKKLAALLSEKGHMVIEVPSADDALLSLYECDEFKKFTYWSQHLFLFNPQTLQRVAEMAGLKVVSIIQHQRYPLSNHMYWLSQGKPGGHKEWLFLDSPALVAAYGNALGAIGKCDTLIAYLELNN